MWILCWGWKVGRRVVCRTLEASAMAVEIAESKREEPYLSVMGVWFVVVFAVTKGALLLPSFLHFFVLGVKM